MTRVPRGEYPFRHALAAYAPPLSQAADDCLASGLACFASRANCIGFGGQVFDSRLGDRAVEPWVITKRHARRMRLALPPVNHMPPLPGGDFRRMSS
jgi:hypothetical protein